LVAQETLITQQRQLLWLKNAAKPLIFQTSAAHSQSSGRMARRFIQ
jgi:hypothetical protein